MKNFSMKRKDSKTFILSYKVEKDQMIIRLASKEKYVIPYTLENEKNVKSRMEEQVLNVCAFENKQKGKFSDAIVNFILAIVIVFISIYVLVLQPKGIHFAWGIVGIVVGGLLAVLAIGVMVRSRKKIKDIYKNRMFIAHEKRLNENAKINSNILFGTTNKTRTLIASNLLNKKPAFTFNTVDRMKYKELKQILENIDRAEQFGFEYQNEKEENPKKESSKKETKNKRKRVVSRPVY